MSESVASLLEQRVDNMLFLLHKFFALFEPVAFTLDVNNGAVVQ